MAVTIAMAMIVMAIMTLVKYIQMTNYIHILIKKGF